MQYRKIRKSAQNTIQNIRHFCRVLLLLLVIGLEGVMAAPGHGGRQDGGMSLCRRQQQIFGGLGLYMDCVLDKIIGGIEAVPGSAPWLVSVQDTSFTKPIHMCGGSIITHLHVLTAAYCIASYLSDIGSVQVVAGEYNLMHDDGWEHSYQVSALVLHDNYNSLTKTYNVAIITVANRIKFNDRVSMISLPLAPPGPATPKDLGRIVGWGSEMESGPQTSVVHEATVEVLDSAQCLKAYPGLTPENFCAGNILNGGVDPCNGDWGGPIVVNAQLWVDNDHIQDGGHQTRSSGVSYVAGIASQGTGCGIPGFPGIYVNTTVILPWIQLIICNDLPYSCQKNQLL